jgi:pyrroline-5-carboxylate reductase
MQMDIGFLGTGAIASAIVKGLCSTTDTPYSILLSPRNAKIAAELADAFTHVKVAHDNQDVLDRSDTVVLAVRPQIVGLLSELRFRQTHLVVSLISTVSLKEVSAMVSPATRVVRAVPLPSVAYRQGPTVVYPPDPTVASLFNRIGTAVEVTSAEQFDSLCSATGSIAPYFAFAQSIASLLTRHHVSKSEARRYVLDMFRALNTFAVVEHDRSFESLSAEHATIGGINEEVLSVLTEHRVFALFEESLERVLRRFASEGWA